MARATEFKARFDQFTLIEGPRMFAHYLLNYYEDEAMRLYSLELKITIGNTECPEWLPKKHKWYNALKNETFMENVECIVSQAGFNMEAERDSAGVIVFEFHGAK